MKGTGVVGDVARRHVGELLRPSCKCGCGRMFTPGKFNRKTQLFATAQCRRRYSYLTKWRAILKLRCPANPPPNSGWEVLWTSPNATQYFVEMDTFDPTSGVQFHYGHVDPTLGES